MSQLDEVSKAIGSLQAQIANIAETQRERADKETNFRHSVLDKLNSVEMLALKLADNKTSVERSHQRIDNLEETIAAARNRIIGGVFVVSMFGSAAAQKFLTFLGMK